VVQVIGKTPILQNLSASRIEKEFAFTGGNLYAGVTEVSNTWYQTFLVQSGKTHYQGNDTLWLNKDPALFRLHYSTLPVFKDHPVVNISHVAAQAYCAWLTQTYMADPGRKHANVVFRLPSLDEWEMAARGGRVGNTFPWGGPYARNSRGCWLCNHHPLPEGYIVPDTASRYGRKVLPYDTALARMADGAEFTCQVRAYFPNDFGLYNLSGNAAEMLSEPGITAGGSWDSETYFTQIPSDPPADTFIVWNKKSQCETYAQPAPTVGFRVFMVVFK